MTLIERLTGAAQHRHDWFTQDAIALVAFAAMWIIQLAPLVRGCASIVILAFAVLGVCERYARWREARARRRAFEARPYG